MDFDKQIDLISEDFKKCHQSLIAICDTNRQLILTTLMYGDCEGTRVGEITKATRLSRPAVSHHLKVLKEAGLVGVHSVGTMNFYYCELGDKAEQLFALAHDIEDFKREVLLQYGDIWETKKRGNLK